MRAGVAIGQHRRVTEIDRPASSSRRVTQLIELGRDREAAELALADSTGEPMEVRSQLDEPGPLLGGDVVTITPDTNPTSSCPGEVQPR